MRKIGLIARTRRPMVAVDVRGTESWVVDPSWLSNERVRSFAGFPLVDRRDVLGVVALFDRRLLDESLRFELDRSAREAGLAIGVALEISSLAQDRRTLLEELSQACAPLDFADSALVGHSSVFRRVMAQIDVAAGSTAPVLVTGERGTGRTSTAVLIHARATGQGGPLLRLELRGRTDEIEARLFDGGSGLLAMASGGTLVLEDLECLPVGAQRRLVAWLDAPPPAAGRGLATRLIATSTRDLRAEAARGQLLPPLLDRLAVIHIDLPALAERDDDVVAIARSLVTRVAKRIGGEPPRLSPGAIDRLRAYRWPGNVAELHAVLDRAVRICGDVLASDSLELPGVVAPADGPSAIPILTRAQLRQRERDSIRAALAAAAGRISGSGGAAELLGMKPTTLASRIRSLGLGAGTRHRGRASRR